MFGGKVLMEFPPIVVDGSVYFMRNNGGTYRLDADTGKVKWKNQIGKLSASSPAYSDGRLFVTLAERARSPRCEPAAASSCGRRSSAAARESSPIVRRGVVYFGTEGGDLYALFAKTGRVKWKFNASGAIKASPALSGSTLYVGDYSGRMYAVWARTGRERWSTGTSGSQFGFAAGNFYSTPAVDFGRVYAGNTDGKVYSFGAADRDARLVQVDRRLRLLLPRRRKRAGHEADRLRRAPTTATCTRSTRAPGPRAGPRGAAAASRAVRRWSAASSTSPTSTPRRPTASTRATETRVFKRSRGVLQPGGLRRQAPLHDRLRERHGARPGEEGAQGWAARAAPGCRPRAGAPWPRARGTRRSGRSTRTAPRRRAPREIASLRCSSRPAPPEAITGMSTASATARVSSRS